MLRKSSTTQIFLLLIQLLLFLTLSILGNKVSELLPIQPLAIYLVIAIIVVLLSLLVNIARFRHQTGEPIVPLLTPKSSVRSMLSTISVLFPLAFAAGVVSAFACTYLFSNDQRLFSGVLWDYEIATFIIALALMSAISLRKLKKSLPLLFSIGFALGATSTFLTLRPEDHATWKTLLGWLVALLLCAVIFRSRPFRAFAAQCRSVFQETDTSNTD